MEGACDRQHALSRETRIEMMDLRAAAITLMAVLAMASPAALAQTAFQNMNAAALADFVAPFSLENDRENRLHPRTVEMLFYGPVDHLFDGMLNVAGHSDRGEFKFDVHEAYLSTSKLIPRSRLKAGRFFLGVGRLNQFHQHDWPFVTAPKVQREFFSPGVESIYLPEGAFDTGVEYAWVSPSAQFIELTVGATNAYCYGHCHTEGLRPPRPLWYLHPTTFFDFGQGQGLLVGTTYLNRKDAAGMQTELFGVDLTFKERRGRRLNWLFQSEVFLQLQDTPGADFSRKMGFYAYPQYGIDDQWSFGVRFDGFSHLNLKFQSNGESRADFDYAIVPTLSYKPSEFTTVRVAYAHEMDTTQGVGDKPNRHFQLQYVQILGAHPAHDF